MIQKLVKWNKIYTQSPINPSNCNIGLPLQLRVLSGSRVQKRDGLEMRDVRHRAAKFGNFGAEMG